MKKIIIVLSCILLMNDNLWAQKSYTASVGLATSRVGMQGSKQVIDRYNETRTWLDKKMGYINPTGGYVFTAGVDKGSYTFSLAFNTQKSTSRASGIAPNGSEAKRELFFKSAFWSFNGMWDFGDIWDLDYGLGINLGGAFGGGSYKTKVTGDPEIKDIMGFDGAGIFLGVFFEHYLVGGPEQGIGIRVTPYYKGFPGLNKKDMQPLLNTLDPANANVPLDNKFSGHGTLGITLETVFRLEWN